MKKYDFAEVEKQVHELWSGKEKKIFDSLQFTKDDIFSWLEGPPTANAPPALHHVTVRVYKDLYLRYKAMRGFNVPRKGGWDCHGLPVEVQVEKKLGLEHKKDVIEFGVNKFIQECQTDVFKFIDEWNSITKQQGFWVDLENAYKTLDTKYVESVWWSLKEIDNKGLLYRGHKVVPYCPRCETPLSSHEVAQGYKNVEEKSVTVQVKLKDEDAYLLVWTTTPWTLPSNNSIAMNPDIDYVYVEDLGEYKGRVYVLAKELLPKYFPEHKIIKTVKGKELEGKHYEPMLPYFPDVKNAYQILMADYVNTEEGTGLVHQAPYGEVDMEVNNAHDVDFVQTLNPDGTFIDEVKDFKGLFAKDADPLIIEWLRKNDKLFIDYDYKHDYPFCWRCDSPLLFYPMKSWFIAVSRIRDRLVQLNEQINWYPSHFKQGRFGNWIAEAKDWALSRNKFWGTPLPAWMCECGKRQMIGSIAELEEKGSIDGKKLEKGSINDIHINTINPITLECPDCGKVMHRTPEVIDVWYDSGSAPFAQFHYPFENKEEFEAAFPYDYIVEAVDQTRGWFYTLHVLATILFDKPAYKNVAVSGLLCDERGEKMSKSRGNVIKPADVFAKYGVDATRLVMASYPLGNQIKFGYGPFQESIMPFFNTLWNSYIFIRPLMEKAGQLKNLRLEDEWILARTRLLVRSITQRIDKHEYSVALHELISFVNDDLSRWYIKLIRDREDEDVLGCIFKSVMKNVLKMLALFAPFISEYLYTAIFDESVHFSDWPVLEEVSDNDLLLVDDMTVARDVLAGILAARDKAGIGVRWPISEVVIDADDKLCNSVSHMQDLLKKQANVKSIEFRKFPVSYDMKPNYRVLGKEFGQETAGVIGLLNDNKDKVIENASEQKDLVLDGKTIKPEHVQLLKKVPVEWELAEVRGASIYLFKRLDAKLEAEGYTREAIRRVQQLRKKAGLSKEDKVPIVIMTAYQGLDNDAIARKVGATEVRLQSNPPLQSKNMSVDKIKGVDFQFFIV